MLAKEKVTGVDAGESGVAHRSAEGNCDMEMRGVPAVGAAKGVFELFVPGLFLLLNLVGIAYYMPWLKEPWERAVEFAKVSPVGAAAVATAIAICFGYLLGVLLRLPQVEPVDQASAAWLRQFHSGVRKKDSNGKPSKMVEWWARDRFPYIRWLRDAYATETRNGSSGEVTYYGTRLPPKAVEFFNRTWTPRQQKTHNKQFANLCRILVTSKDPALAAELYANESLCRYVSGMFYALLISMLLALGLLVCVTPWAPPVPSSEHLWVGAGYLLVGVVVFVVRRDVGHGGIKGIRTVFVFLSAESGLVLLLNNTSTDQFPLAWGLLVYAPAVLLILRNFRFLRIKEAEAVFAACFACSVSRDDALEALLVDPGGGVRSGEAEPQREDRELDGSAS